MESNLNFNSSICTSRSQSERLLKLGIKAETADMAHIAFGGGGMMIRPYEWLPTTEVDMENFIPAWSLDRLIELLKDKDTPENYKVDFFVNDINRFDEIISLIQSLIHIGRINNDFLNIK